MQNFIRAGGTGRGIWQQEDVSTWNPVGRHNFRVKILILFGALIAIAVSGGWGIYFLGSNLRILSVVDFAAVFLSAFAAFLAFQNRLRLAATIICHVLLVTITISSVAEASPSAIPASNHMNYLPLAAATYLIFRRDRLYQRTALPLIILAIFLAFLLGLVPAFWPELTIPGAARAIGHWTNNIWAVVGTCTIIAIMQWGKEERSALELDMRKALARGEYSLHFQPQVDASSRILGAEALLRWHHASRGNISPQEFIPLAEETGVIVPIGDWVLRAACAQLSEWSKEPETAHLRLAVNISATQFRQPDFVQNVEQIIGTSGIDTSRLEFELTESALADDIDTVVHKMKALQQLGIRWSLDDFGTGYSSLHAVKRLPLSQLKIDQSFVRDLLTDESNIKFVETIIQLGEHLKIDVIAEGVETAEQMQMLEDAGCPSFQGYLFGRPMPPAEFGEFVAEFCPPKQKPQLIV